MSQHLHAQRTALLHLALPSPGLQLGGVAVIGSHIIFHWPTFWERSRLYLAAALNLALSTSWQEALPTLLAALPGRPVADSALIGEQGLPPLEAAVCEVPYDATFIGLLPDQWTHPELILAHSHWFAQLLYAVQDLSSPDGPAKTGVWRDGVSGRVVINWALRAEYHPKGDVRHPFLVEGVDNPFSVPATLRIKRDTSTLVKRHARLAVANTLRRSPWPDGLRICTVVDPHAVAEQHDHIMNQPPKRPTVYHVWTRAFDPYLQEVEGLLDVDRHYFHDWARKNGLRAFPYKAIWLRQQWAIALPVGTFSNRWGDETAVLADKEARDRFIQQTLRKSRSVEEYLRAKNVITYQGDDYYTASALEAFVSYPEHYYVFAFLRAFLAYARHSENQDVIANRSQRLRRRQHASENKYEKGRTPNWTPEEDAELRVYFGPRATDDDPVERRRALDEEAWAWLTGPRSRIRECHRTVKQIKYRVKALNEALYAECCTRGVMTPSGWKRYCLNRLGQKERAA